MAGHLSVARFFYVWWITARSAIHQRAGQAIEDVRIYRYPVEVDVSVNG